MSLTQLLSTLASHLIEIMVGVTVVALFLRYVAYKACASIQAYVQSLSRGVEKALATVEYKGDVDSWMKDIFDNVEKELPDRGVRFASIETARRRFAGDRRNSTNDYFAIKQNLSRNIAAQSDALKISSQPNFSDLSSRVLRQDIHWQRIFRVISVDTLQRTFAIMPSLYIVAGILGTFIGISSALPMIGHLDLGNMQASGAVLSEFVDHISYSMHTSIAGIAFSVAMTLLNTLFPLAIVRREVQNIMANLFENLWNEIHKDNIRLGEKKIIDLLQTIADSNGTAIRKVA